MFGEVAERSNATDCKSVGLAPSEVRILPSPPACACRSGTGRQERLGRQGTSATDAGSPRVELIGRSGIGGCVRQLKGQGSRRRE